MRRLALFHGFTGCGDSWEAVRDPLHALAGPGAFDLWTPDLPGHGPDFDESAASESFPESFEGTVDRLAEDLDTRFPGPERVEVAGYSLGARLALGLAVRHPERVARLGLVGARAGLDADERLVRAAQDDARAESLLKQGVDAFVDRWRALPLFATQERLPASVRAAHDRRRRSHSAAGLAWAVRVLSPGRMPDYRADLARLDLPVDVVVGEEDERFRPLAREIAEALPRARLHVVPATGHDVVLESPSGLAAIFAEPPGSHR